MDILDLLSCHEMNFAAKLEVFLNNIAIGIEKYHIRQVNVPGLTVFASYLCTRFPNEQETGKELIMKVYENV